MTENAAHHPPLAEGLLARVHALRGAGRRLVAVAGAPASGKSVLGATLTGALADAGVTAALVPMDGFHLDNRILDARGLRARKGAPETFDAAGFVALVHRIRAGGEVVYPLFDRARDLSIAGAGVIAPECEIVIIEGNYLLFDAPPWSDLPALWDLSIWLDTSEEVILARCVARWLAHGHDPDAARARAQGNDLPNARRIMAARLPADIMLSDP
ncbi:MAG: nucleoside/nucleotide kinase family protein [Roseinatronobacter sp.]